MAKIYIHIGLHKTGTTTLQKQLFPACEGLNYIQRPALRRAIYSVTTEDPVYFDKVKVRKELLSQVTESRPNLISRECLSGSLGAGIIKRGLDNRSSILNNLQAAVPEANIILVIRRQDDFARSLYRQYLKLGGTERIEQFFGVGMAALPLAPISLFKYGPYIDSVLSRFKNGVLVLLFEEFVENPELFIEKLANYLGVETPKINIKNSNQSRLGATEMEVSRIMNRLFRNQFNPGGLFTGIPIAKHRRTKFTSPLAFVHSGWPWKRTIKNDSKLYRVSEEILNQVKDDNRAIDKEFNLGLQNYGYY